MAPHGECHRSEKPGYGLGKFQDGKERRKEKKGSVDEDDEEKNLQLNLVMKTRGRVKVR